MLYALFTADRYGMRSYSGCHTAIGPNSDGDYALGPSTAGGYQSGTATPGPLPQSALD